jgi:MarR family transcriptional regulator for hemolysin
MNSPTLQTTPRPPALRRLRRLHLLAQALGDRLAREQGLTMQQWELLMLLRCCGGSIAQRDACRHFAVSPPTLTSLVDAAERRGWIERSTNRDDRRQRRIELTPDGRALIESAPHLGRKVDERMTRGFSPQELAELDRLLAQASANLEGEL